MMCGVDGGKGGGVREGGSGEEVRMETGEGEEGGRCKVGGLVEDEGKLKCVGELTV